MSEQPVHEGPLELSEHPVGPFDAATKYYVDTATGEGGFDGGGEVPEEDPDDPTANAPQNVAVVGALRTATVVWDSMNLGGLGGYTIQLDSTNSFDSGNLQEANTRGTVKSFGDLLPGNVYYARVRATDASGNTSGWSTIATATLAQVSDDDIVAGTITGDRIAVGTLHGDRIEVGSLDAGAIGAGKIDAEYIEVGSIDVDSLSGDTITAYDFIREAEDGQYTIEISSIGWDGIPGVIWNCGSSTVGAIYADVDVFGRDTLHILAGGTYGLIVTDDGDDDDRTNLRSRSGGLNITGGLTLDGHAVVTLPLGDITLTGASGYKSSSRIRGENALQLRGWGTGSTQRLYLGNDGTEECIWVPTSTSGDWRPVTFGPDDSAGTGYKALRIPNNSVSH